MIIARLGYEEEQTEVLPSQDSAGKEQVQRCDPENVVVMRIFLLEALTRFQVSDHPYWTGCRAIYRRWMYRINRLYHSPLCRACNEWYKSLPLLVNGLVLSGCTYSLSYRPSIHTLRLTLSPGSRNIHPCRSVCLSCHLNAAGDGRASGGKFTGRISSAKFVRIPRFVRILSIINVRPVDCSTELCCYCTSNLTAPE